jgi:hypothetical protein
MTATSLPKPSKTKLLKQVATLNFDDSRLFTKALLSRIVEGTDGFMKPENFFFDQHGTPAAAAALSYGRIVTCTSETKDELLKNLKGMLGSVTLKNDDCAPLEAYDRRVEIELFGQNGMVVRIL